MDGSWSVVGPLINRLITEIGLFHLKACAFVFCIFPPYVIRSYQLVRTQCHQPGIVTILDSGILPGNPAVTEQPSSLPAA